MNHGAYSEREACVVIALNILTGYVNPDQWRGLRRVDEEDAAVLDKFQEVREWGHGRVEVVVLNHKIDTAYKSLTFKRKDLIKDRYLTKT